MAPTIVRRLTLTEDNHRTGKTNHYYATGIDNLAAVDEMPFLRVPVPPPYALMVVRFSDNEFNLIHLSQDGKEVTDTYHETLADAQLQAQLEFSDRWTIENESH